MSETSGSRPREINQTEAVSFKDLVTKFESFMLPEGSSQVSLINPELSIVDAEVGSVQDAQLRACFEVDDYKIVIEEDVLELEMGEHQSETASWSIIIFEIVGATDESSEGTVYKQRTFSVAEYGESALCPYYEERYRKIDAYTGEPEPMRSEIDQMIIDSIKGLDDPHEVVRILSKATEAREAGKKELEDITGMTDASGDIFSPERFDEVTRLVSKIKPEHQVSVLRLE